MTARVPHLLRAAGRLALLALATYALHSRTSPLRVAAAGATGLDVGPDAVAPAAPSLHCSFCGKSTAEVSRLVAGPSACICDDCVITSVRALVPVR